MCCRWMRRMCKRWGLCVCSLAVYMADEWGGCEKGEDFMCLLSWRICCRCMRRMWKRWGRDVLALLPFVWQMNEEDVKKWGRDVLALLAFMLQMNEEDVKKWGRDVFALLEFIWQMNEEDEKRWGFLGCSMSYVGQNRMYIHCVWPYCPRVPAKNMAYTPFIYGFGQS